MSATSSSEVRITQATLVKEVKDSRKKSVTPTKSKSKETYEVLSPRSSSTISESIRYLESDSGEDIVKNSQVLRVSKLRKMLERKRKSKNQDATLKASPNEKCNFKQMENDFKRDEDKSNFDTSTPNTKRRKIIDSDEQKDIFNESKEKNCGDAQTVVTDNESNRLSISLGLNESEAIDMLHSLEGIRLTDIEMSSIPTAWNCDERDLTKDTSKAQVEPFTKRSKVERRGNTSESKIKNANKQREKAESTTEATESNSQESPKSNNEDNTSEEFNNESLEEDQHELTVIARKIVEELAAIEKKEGLPKELRNKLRNLKVQLRHEVPPQHEIEKNAGSHVPTQKQKRLFKKYGPIKYGPFSEMEDKLIENNWKAFCKVHKWNSKNVKAFLYMRHKNKYYVRSLKERKKFVQFLADGLPWRTLYSVYHRFRILYSSYVQQRYNAEESKKILAYIKNNSYNNEKINKKFSDLAKVLERSRASVWSRYQTLKRGIRENDLKVEWTLPLIAKFIKKLLKVTLSDDIEELKDAMIPKVVWQKLENKLKIDHTVLKKFWLQQLHMQLFCKKPIYLSDVKIKLIEYFYESGISQMKQINWPNVAKYFDGMTSTFLSTIFYRIIHAVSFRTTSSDLWHVLTFLYETRLPQIRDSRNDKLLPRIIYENGTVKIIDNSSIRLR